MDPGRRWIVLKVIGTVQSLNIVEWCMTCMHMVVFERCSQDERFDECRDAVGRNRVTGLNRHHGHVTKVDPALADRGAPLRAYVLTYRNQ